jgi:hypothetical protein
VEISRVCCISKKETGRAAMPQLLFPFSHLFFTTFNVASHAPAFIGYIQWSVVNSICHQPPAFKFSLCIDYSFFIRHFRLCLCVLGVFHRIIASIMTRELRSTTL